MRTPRTHAAFEFVEADLLTAELEALLDGVDVVYHQAAQAGVRLSWSHGFADYVNNNVLATQRLLEAIVVARPTARVVYASSSSVYGNQARYPVQETDLPAPFSPYGVTKLAAEHLCGLYAANAGVRTISLRYFTVFGPRQRPDMSIYRLCEAALRGTPFPRFGDGSQMREFTFVDDIVRANLLAADADVEPGAYVNIAGGSEITLSDLIALVGDAAGAVGEDRRASTATGRHDAERRRDRARVQPARLGTARFTRRRRRRATRLAPGARVADLRAQSLRVR